MQNIAHAQIWHLNSSSALPALYCADGVYTIMLSFLLSLSLQRLCGQSAAESLLQHAGHNSKGVGTPLDFALL